MANAGGFLCDDRLAGRRPGADCCRESCRVTTPNEGKENFFWTALVSLTTEIVGDRVTGMQDVAVIENAAAAEASLDPIRARMLAKLAEPHTATTLAARLGLTRQKVNYHIKTLEQHGLVELVEERRKGNMTERVVRASAAAYVISPAALAALAPDPTRSPDRLSARWLLALAARLVRETGALINGAAQANKPLATFALDAEVRFAKPADRAAFVAELTDALAGIISKYHTETGRPHRLIVAVHPSITEDADPPAEEQ